MALSYRKQKVWFVWCFRIAIVICTMTIINVAVIIRRSKEASYVQSLMEEKDVFEMQAKALQDLLRANANELEHLKQLLKDAPTAVDGDKDKKKDGEGMQQIQERINSLREAVKTLQDQIKETENLLEAERKAEAEKASQEPEPNSGGVEPPREGGEEGDPVQEPQDVASPVANASINPKIKELEEKLSNLQEELVATESTLQEAEQEAEEGSTALIRATRARNKLEKEAKEKQLALERALEQKVAESVSLQEELSTLKSESAQAIDVLRKQLQDKETECSQLQSKVTSIENAMELLQKSLTTLEKEKEETVKKVETERKHLEDVEKKASKDRDEDIKALMKLKDAEFKTSLKNQEAEHKKALKEKEEEIKKLQAAAKKALQAAETSVALAEMTTKFEASQEALVQLTSATAELTRQREEAEADARSLRERLIKRENKLTAVTQEKAEAEALVSSLTADIKRLTKRMEKSKVQQKELEDNYKIKKGELEHAIAELQATKGRLEELESKLSETTAALEVITEERDDLQARLDTCLKDIEERKEAMTQLEKAVTTSAELLQTQSSDFLIGNKLTKQMNAELKAALSAETRKVRRLERQLQTLQNAFNAQVAEQSSGGGAAIAPSPRLHAGTPGLPSSRSLGSDAGFLGVTAGAPSPVLGPNPVLGFRPAPSATVSQAVASGKQAMQGRALPRTGSGTAGFEPSGQAPATGAAQRNTAAPAARGGDQDANETVRLLGARLHDVLAENEVTREKVSMLEGIVQSLSKELEEKDKLLAQIKAQQQQVQQSISHPNTRPPPGYPAAANPQRA